MSSREDYLIWPFIESPLDLAHAVQVPFYGNFGVRLTSLFLKNIMRAPVVISKIAIIAFEANSGIGV